MSVGNASVLEILWVLFGVICYRYSIRTHRKARRNLRLLRESGRNGRYGIAGRRNLHEETFRVLISVVVIAVGLIACATPPTTKTPVTVVGVSITVGLFLITVLVTLGARASSKYYDTFEVYADRRKRGRSARGDE